MFNNFFSLVILVHLAAGEGHILCLKYLISIATKAEGVIKARNNQVCNNRSHTHALKDGQRWSLFLKFGHERDNFLVPC